MIVIGLTGSIGMGKSTIASMFRHLGIHVCCADDIVHQLLAEGGKAVAAVGNAFPGAVEVGAVNRKKLGEIVFADKAKLKQLEHILHPRVVAEETAFAERERLLGAQMAVIDIPLLFETGAEERCDLTVVATAPFFLQKQRVMKRPGMTEAKFAAILKAQMPDREKRNRADAVIHTGLGRRHSFVAVAELVELIRRCW